MVADFEARLAASADRVEVHLQHLLADREGVPQRLAAATRHGVLGGGKRLRPFLVMESARLLDVDPEAALAVAAALECIHCYSLVHDDLPAMDNDAIRRGRPTVWRAWDDWTAILVGDGLLTLAFEVAADPAVAMAPAARARIVCEMARAAGFAGMVGGQYLDMAAERRGEPPAPDAVQVRRLQAMKTGALIHFATVSGAILAGADAPTFDALSAYGRGLGLAFQIADDLLDVEGDARRAGKAVGKDAAAGKATLVGLLGIAGARAELATAHAAAVGALAPFGARADTLRAAADFVVARDR